MLRPLSAQIVGSYVKPRWLVDHDLVRSNRRSCWLPGENAIDEARQDAALLAIYDQERAGLSVVNDGEAQRAAYDRHFLSVLTGLDYAHLEEKHRRAEVETRKSTDPDSVYLKEGLYSPTVTREIEWHGPVSLDEVRFLKRRASRPIKWNIVGPLTLSNCAVDKYYGDPHEFVFAIARALNKEIRAVEAEGVDLIQIDEPAFHSALSVAREIGVEVIRTMVEGVRTPVFVHVCYGYALVYGDKKPSSTYPEVLEILSDCPIAGISVEYQQPRHTPDLLRYCGDKHVALGLIDLADKTIETPEHVASRIREALSIVEADRLHPCTDCGMWYLDRPTAFGKISALAKAAGIVRLELGIRDLGDG